MGDAYWALGYQQYFANNKNLFACPDGIVVDQWREDVSYPSSFGRTRPMASANS
ncbi:MAG: hypothetical protein WDM76_16985 [Limisphaerales bacterium]